MQQQAAAEQARLEHENTLNERDKDVIYQTPLDSVSDILISMDSNATDITVLEKPVAEGIIAAHPEYTYISLVTPFDVAMEDAMKQQGTAVIEVIIEKDEFVLPMLPPGGSIDDIIVSIDKEENSNE